LEDVGSIFNYLNIIIVCLSEEQKINVIISIMSRKKVRQNNAKSPRKYQPRPMQYA